MTLDLKGQIFNLLTVVELSDKTTKLKCRLWKCKCQCETITYVTTANLRSGNSKSCGCNTKIPSNFFNLKDQIFGSLLVLERASNPTKTKWVTYWKCQCNCGNTTIVKASHLKAGKIKSCGCITDFTNTSFGDLLVINKKEEEMNGIRKIKWVCLCSCGNTINISHERLLCRRITHCGCKSSFNRSISHGGNGIPKTRYKILHYIRSTKEYKLWMSLCKEIANYRCAISGSTSDLEIHHIVSLRNLIETNKISKLNYKLYASLLFNIDNGYVISKELHSEFHSIYGFRATKSQLEEFKKNKLSI